MTKPDLLPCPFCGGEMENRGYGAIHKGGDGKCALSGYGFRTDEWSRRAPASPVKVRNLVWGPPLDPYEAETPFGLYTISDHGLTDVEEWHWTFHNYLYGDPSETAYPTEAAAKAAAQADYEARILSTLEQDAPESPVPPSIGIW